MGQPRVAAAYRCSRARTPLRSSSGRLAALEVTLLAAVWFLAAAWCPGWLLPRRARAQH